MEKNIFYIYEYLNWQKNKKNQQTLACTWLIHKILSNNKLRIAMKRREQEKYKFFWTKYGSEEGKLRCLVQTSNNENLSLIVSLFKHVEINSLGPQINNLGPQRWSNHHFIYSFIYSHSRLL
jgi:hypothetical protein